MVGIKELARLAYISMKIVRENPTFENATHFVSAEQGFLCHPNTKKNLST